MLDASGSFLVGNANHVELTDIHPSPQPGFPPSDAVNKKFNSRLVAPIRIAVVWQSCCGGIDGCEDGLGKSNTPFLQVLIEVLGHFQELWSHHRRNA